MDAAAARPARGGPTRRGPVSAPGARSVPRGAPRRGRHQVVVFLRHGRRLAEWRRFCFLVPSAQLGPVVCSCLAKMRRPEWPRGAGTRSSRSWRSAPRWRPSRTRACTASRRTTSRSARRPRSASACAIDRTAPRARSTRSRGGGSRSADAAGDGARVLAKAGEPRPLRVELTPYGDEGVVRLRVDEPAHPRYVVPDVLVDDLSPSEFADVQFAHQSGGKGGTDGGAHGVLTKNPDVDVVVTHAPFRVAVRVRGHETTVFNRRSLFEFEYKRDGPAEGESWSESFNSHTDSRPNGPTALAFDVTFPDAEHVYGIPERATSLSLKETRDATGQAVTEPYRMYNLDVFEYLAESPFGLYGSIPVMLGERGCQQTGVRHRAGARSRPPSTSTIRRRRTWT